MTGGISKIGDAMVRTALYEAANVMLARTSRFSALKRWVMEAARVPTTDGSMRPATG